MVVCDWGAVREGETRVARLELELAALMERSREQVERQNQALVALVEAMAAVTRERREA